MAGKKYFKKTDRQAYEEKLKKFLMSKNGIPNNKPNNKTV